MDGDNRGLIFEVDIMTIQHSGGPKPAVEKLEYRLFRFCTIVEMKSFMNGYKYLETPHLHYINSSQS